MIYLITRHPGALEWLQSRVSGPVVHLQHLEEADVINRNDTVIGTLPVGLAEEICRRGARYLHLEINLPMALRGQDLSARELTELGAALVEYVVFCPCDDELVLHLAAEREDW